LRDFHGVLHLLILRQGSLVSFSKLINIFTYCESIPINLTLLPSVLASINDKPLWVDLYIFNPLTGVNVCCHTRELHLLKFELGSRFLFGADFAGAKIVKTDTRAFTWKTGNQRSVSRKEDGTHVGACQCNSLGALP
jgi:hypothetical protein